MTQVSRIITMNPKEKVYSCQQDHCAFLTTSALLLGDHFKEYPLHRTPLQLKKMLDNRKYQQSLKEARKVNKKNKMADRMKAVREGKKKKTSPKIEPKGIPNIGNRSGFSIPIPKGFKTKLKYCTACGGQREQGWDYCGHCGVSLS